MKGPLVTPEMDDRHILGIIFGMTSAQALYVAHDLKLFSVLADAPLSLAELAARLGLRPRPVQALVSICCAQKLLRLDAQELYVLSEVSRRFLLPESPTYMGAILDQGLRNPELASFASLKASLLTDAPQVYGGDDLFETNAQKEEQARAFTRCMHGKSMAAATAWPHVIDLGGHRKLLDIGGGSGAHSIGVVSCWPHVRATVYDRPLVCQVAEEFIDASGLRERINTVHGDMWHDPLPEADIHFYSDIFHDWPPEKCQFLVEKSYTAMDHGGRIIIHEMLFNDTKTGPLSVAAYNVRMMQWTQGQQFSGGELRNLLKAVGFREIEVLPTGFGDWRMVTGVKGAPSR